MIGRTAVACLLAAATLAAAEDRAEDREAIRSHIDRIFKAFINKDAEDLKATHDANWLGFLEGSNKAIHGLDEYMKYTGNFTPGSPYGMTGYRMREFDIAFQGDAAFVTFVAEVDSKTPTGPGHSVLRIADFYAKRKWSLDSGRLRYRGSPRSRRGADAATPNPVRRRKETAAGCARSSLAGLFHQ